MKKNDQYILKQLRKGDIKVFESLFHSFHPGMLLYSISILKNRSLAEEVVQDVFYNIWKNRNEFLIKTSWHSYLYKSVYNNSLMVLRKKDRSMRLEEDTLKNIPGNGIDPSEEIDFNVLNSAVKKTLEEMPERTRNIFSMSRNEGMKYKEIAKQLNISIKTVEANMGKALRAFRLSLKDYGY